MELYYIILHIIIIGFLFDIYFKTTHMANSISDVNAKLDELQTKLDEEQEQVRLMNEKQDKAAADLQTIIDELRANQQDPTEIESAIAKIESIKADLATTEHPLDDSNPDQPVERRRSADDFDLDTYKK